MGLQVDAVGSIVVLEQGRRFKSWPGVFLDFVFSPCPQGSPWVLQLPPT